MIKFIVDRIEENFVLCEDAETGNIEKIEYNLLPINIKEGDMLIYDKKRDKYYIDEKGTNFRKKEIKRQMKEVWK